MCAVLISEDCEGFNSCAADNKTSIKCPHEQPDRLQEGNINFEITTKYGIVLYANKNTRCLLTYYKSHEHI